MNCIVCGIRSETIICAEHFHVYGDDWAKSNRVMCDFFHRGVIPPRVIEQEYEYLEGG